MREPSDPGNTPDTLDEQRVTDSTATLDGDARPGTSLARGAVVARYVIVGELGRGGMGAVYAAYDPDLDRRIALKVLAHGAGSRSTTREPRFLREAQALAQLSHENVVAVHDVGIFRNAVFIAMELVPGPTLAAWLKDAPRSRREIVATFLAAGRGLAAAHAAGLVHRDFKPGNVMVGNDGRVRVLDFGLARAASSTSSSDEEGPEESLTSSGSRLLAQSITVAGSLLGTPAYMSPEQLRRLPANERSDQFSFAVALYEALYGAHPFGRGSREELTARVLEGRIGPPPADAKVPARIRRLLQRALALTPEDRFPSMDALLAELARDPSARWRRVGLGAGAIALASTAVFSFTHRAQPAGGPLCEGFETELAGAWDNDVRARVHVAFTRVAGPFGEDTSTVVGGVLDDYAHAWTAMQSDACREARVLQIQSLALLDLRTACLARRRDALGALTDTLAHAGTRAVVTHAVDAAYALPALAPCADAEALLSATPLPDGAPARAKISAARRVIDGASARLQAGDADAAIALLAPLGDGAALAYAPAQAELLHTLSSAQAASSHDVESAEQTLWKALAAAAEAKDDRLTATLWIALVGHVGFDRARPDDTIPLRRNAELAITRAGHAPQLDADLRHDLALMEWRRGRYDEARALVGDALAIHQRLHGDRHPDVAGDLVLLGSILTDRGDYAEAQPVQERALAARQALLGATHPYVADTLDNLGVVLYHQGRLDAALARYREALSIRERALGPDHPDVGTSLNNVGGVDLDRGRLDDAARSFTRALSIWETSGGQDEPSLAVVLDNLGDVALARSDWGGARATCERAYAIESPSVPADSPNLAFHLTCLGEARLGEGKAAAAVAPLERALAIRAAGTGDPIDLARTRFALARALVADSSRPSARARAIELARLAYDAFGRSDDRVRVRRDAAAAWLAAHRR
jgi:tetratricopeptide (TPR) repeat protein